MAAQTADIAVEQIQKLQKLMLTHPILTGSCSKKISNRNNDQPLRLGGCNVFRQ